MFKIKRNFSSIGRMERCFTDNIYLIEALPPDSEDDTERTYVIMGHSGNVYNVTIANRPHCTCPDFYLRRNRCKHIYFVLMRIMNIENPTDKFYDDDELIEMFSNIPPITQNLMYKGPALPNEGKEVEQKFEAGDICPICLDPLENGKELDFCRYSCGKTIHKKCFSMWEKSKGSICVFCRAQWYSNNYSQNHKRVSQHPIDMNNINIDNNDDNNDINMDNEEDNEENMDLDSDEESDNSSRRKEKKKRKKSRGKSRSRNRSRSRNKSRSRSRDSRKNKKKEKKYRYPKD
jgi:hypothetical protein